MTDIIYKKTYPEPEFNRREILRYAQCREAGENVTALMEECISEVQGKLTYKVCWREFCISETAGVLDLGFMQTPSADLRKNLEGCDSIVLFGATVGLEMDRLIARYGRVSPAKGVMFQALGAERIEGLCDSFNRDVRERVEKEGRFTKPRFSPGYGDLPLETQKDIFRVLECPRKIGLSLNDSLLMTPSKSVTAIIGITTNEQQDRGHKCAECQKFDCSFRS